MPEPEVLVICSKGGLPQWRQTIARSGLAKSKVSLINFERTKSLLAPLPRTTRRSTRAKNRELAKSGTPKAVWRLVVIDEAHRLRNPYAQQSMVCRQIVAAARFTLFISATAGQAPHELSYLGGLLGAATGTPMHSLADFRLLMQRLEIGKAKGRWTNWSWSGNEADRGRMAQLLYTGRTAIGLRRLPQDIAGWPDVQRELAPTALSPDERRLYALTWRDFRHELGLLGGSRRRAAGWAATLRFRQKASLLRIGGDGGLRREPARRRPSGGDLGRLSRNQRDAGRHVARTRLGGARVQRHPRGGQQRGGAASPSRRAPATS